MRTFLGIALSPELRPAMKALQNALDLPGAEVRRVPEENLHLTLKFIGELPAEQVSLMCPSLEEVVAGHGAFDLEFTGVGTFPPQGAPKIVWVGCGGGAERASALAGAVEKTCEKGGVLRDERPYAPHLTIGRANVPAKATPLLTRLNDYEGKSFGTQMVREIVLVESRLEPRGASYSVVDRFSLS